MDHVEVRNCGQRDTGMAAIRFDTSREGDLSTITNSAVHGSLGWLLNIKNSHDINISTTAFIGGRGIGINLHMTLDVHLDEIFVSDINDKDG